MAPLWRKAKDSKILISKRNRDFCFLPTRKKRQNITVWGGAKGGDKRWSKNLHRIRVFLTDLQYFAYQENVVGFLLLSKLKTVGKMKRSSFNVLFFLKKTKLLKNGEASVCMRITVDGTRVENNIRKSGKYKARWSTIIFPIDPSKKHWIYEKKNAF